jgi:tRNA(Ile)-lysidine synthase
MSDIIEHVLRYCRHNELLKAGDRVLVAVSGGPDSIALLHIMCAIKSSITFELSTAHLEHGLRGESSVRDMEFVKKVADKLGIVFYSRSTKVANEKASDESFEEAARRVRYQFLLDILQKTGFNKVATGHTFDDNIETIIYRLITGTGPSGFTGILPQNQCVIHPLLGCSKEEILFFLRSEGYKYRIDETNSDTRIPRNKIRHEILPLLSDINIKFKQHITNLSVILREENDILEEIAENQLLSLIIEESKNKISIDYERFSDLNGAIKRRVVLALLRKLTDQDCYQYSAANYLAFDVIDDLTGGLINGNKILYQNKSIIIRKEYGNLIFQKRVVDDAKKKYLYHVKRIGEKIVLREIGRQIKISVEESVNQFEENKLYFDLDKVEFPILIRNRTNGDSIRLRNLGQKKLKTIFINDKVPPSKRDEIPVVVINDEIAGIFSTYCGKKNRVAENFMISELTSKILICDLSSSL